MYMHFTTFSPKNEDEVDFRAGEPIEVIERDDQYSDGWWQGRNLAESTAGPSINEPPDILQTVDEEAASFIGSDAESNIGVALGEPPSTHQEEVMHATMTDVQKAIEQLGRDDRDGTRSFSSLALGTETRIQKPTEIPAYGRMERTGTVVLETSLQNRHVKSWNAKAAAGLDIRSLAPPIDIEMSDESEAEEVDDTFQN
ncbi:hypothetical protein EV424DRAFT_1351117, partial [Suillus variegatus]